MGAFGWVPVSQALFMLVSALMGMEAMQAAYAHDIAEGYRFGTSLLSRQYQGT